MFKFLSSVILLSFSFLYVFPLSAETPKGQGPGKEVLQKKTAPLPVHGGGPHEYLPVTVNGTTFFYAAGLFYQRASDEYVLVAPPRGAVVPVLPEGSMMVTVNGGTYYYYSHTYYTMNPNGAYMVVNDPTAPPPPTPPVTAAPTANPQSSKTTTTTTVYPAQQQLIITRPAPLTIVRSPDSQNPIKKLGRGLFCAAFGFLEIPKNMGETARKEGMPQAMSYGFLKGVGFFILRETVGALEAGTFLFPLPGTIENGVRDWGYGPPDGTGVDNQITSPP